MKGLDWQGHEDGGIFLGVPFAAPPVGDLRWQPPQAVSPGETIVDTTGYAPACMQGDYIVSWYEGLASAFGGDPGQVGKPVSESEDCLYLNVWTPDLTPEEPMPVMVWIHGGSYRGGWSYEPNYVGRDLAGEGVVVVSIAYRLGAFGYLGPGAEDGAPVNFGMMDQLAALDWIGENIASFGGDAGNLTLFGESAGAAAIGTLTVTPQADGLFQRAISQSAGFEFLSVPTRAEAGEAFASLARELADEGTSPEAATSEQILQASNTVLGDYDYAPVVDGDFLKDQPATLLEAGKLNPVDLLIGTNRDEWLMYLDRQSVEADLAAWTKRAPGAAALIARMVEEVGADEALDRVETAYQMRCPGRSFAGYVSTTGKNAYVYEFDRRREGSVDAGLGSYHGAEIPYVFGTHDEWLPTDDTDMKITKAMMKAWTRFAATGDPGTGGGKVWPEFGKTGLVLSIDDPVTVSRPRDAALCDDLQPGLMEPAE